MNTTVLYRRHPIDGFSIRDSIISHPAFQSAMERIERLHQWHLSSKQASGLLITGLSGSGKSTLRNEYKNRFPDVDDGTINHIRVLSVETPPGPTVKNLAEAILVAMGDPKSYQGSAEQKTNRIFEFLKQCGVELLLIDELQHFLANGNRSEAMKVTDWLKAFINRAGVPVVLFGLPECELLLTLNVQLARRFSARYYLRPFCFDSDQEKLQFLGILKALESLLPMPSISLSTEEMGKRFYCACHGLMDYLCKIIDGAVQIAFRKQSPSLDIYLFAEAFEEEVWRDAPAEINPFSAEEEDLRDLNMPGEPFSSIATASPLAKWTTRLPSKGKRGRRSNEL
jgi:type II secretory pathway predicted ATPase ExeA